MWTVTIAFLSLVLDQLAANGISVSSAAALQGLYFGLGIAPTPTPTPTTQMSDIVEATYTGYARQAVTWYPPFIEASGPFLLEGHSLKFTPLDAVTPNVITFAFLADALTGGKYLMGTLLPSSGIPLPGPLSSAIADPAFSLPFDQVYGGPELTN